MHLCANFSLGYKIHQVNNGSILPLPSGFYPPTYGLMFPPLSGSSPLSLRAPLLPCFPSMALSAPFPFSFSLLRFPMLYAPFPLRSVFPFSFLVFFPEGPHTQLEGPANQVL